MRSHSESQGRRAGSIWRGLLPAFAAALVAMLAPAQALAANGSITGTVTDISNGEPIVGIKTCALKTTNDIPDTCEPTGASGKYTILGLPPGTYRVIFAPTSSKSDYLMQYYDQKPSFDTADFATVTSGAQTTGIDAQLQPGGRIKGSVVDASDKTPLAGIQVCARRAANDETVRCAFSEGDGSYTISGLVTDSYKVSFYASDEELNYIEQFYKGKPSFNGAESIAVTAGASVTGIDAEMQPGGLVEGTVTDAETGVEIEGIPVCVYEADSTEIYECAQTDAAGNYKIDRLLTGSYKVGFLPEFNSLNYLAQYYNDQPSLEAADALSLVVGETAAGIDAELQKGARIAGTAIDAVSKDPIPELEVCAYRNGEDEHERCTSTDPDGEYAIVGLRAGSYKVGFFSIDYVEGTGGPNYIAQFYDGKSSLAAAEAIPVTTGSETTGIDAEMLEGARIKGTVIDAESKEAIWGITVCAFKVGASLPERCSYTDFEGKYGITALPSGEYTVEFSQGEEPNYLRQYYDGKSSPEEAEPVSVTAGSDLTGIDAEMHAGGRIEGFVSEISGDPVLELIRVCALTPDGDVAGCTWTFFDGEYTITGLESGTYKVVFAPEFEDEFETRYYDEKDSLAEATPVSVSVGMTTTGIDATLTRLPAELPPGSSEAPSLTGTPALGGTLTCSQGSWEGNPTEYAYTWLRDGAPISGETSSAHAVQAADQGHAIACEVTATNEYGSASAKSNALQIPAAANPTPAGQPAPPASGEGSSTGHGKARKPLKCKKGFRKKTVHGKTRCVKRHKRRRAAT